MSRKTCSVEDMRQRVNAMLADSVCSADVRLGMCQVLEAMLHETGNYRGFSYLAPREVPLNQLPGINEVAIDLPHEQQDALYRARFDNTDDTRRRYF